MGRVAISKALRSMEDRDDVVRLAAADAVVRLTPKGDEQTISGVRRLFHRRNARVRVASLLVLGKIAQNLEDRQLEAAVTRLTDAPDEGVREAAYDAFSALL